jgi:hypothetical protein
MKPAPSMDSRYASAGEKTGLVLLTFRRISHLWSQRFVAHFADMAGVVGRVGRGQVGKAHKIFRSLPEWCSSPRSIGVGDGREFQRC